MHEAEPRGGWSITGDSRRQFKAKLGSHMARHDKNPAASAVAGQSDATDQQARRAVDQSESSADSSPDDAGTVKVRKRIDGAHRIAHGPAEDERPPADGLPDERVETADVSTPDELSSPPMREQLRLQAEQLASHLRAQQYQLDRREAQLNAREAQQENEARAARLWLRERQQELAEQEAELRRRGQELEIGGADRGSGVRGQGSEKTIAEPRAKEPSPPRVQSDQHLLRQRELDEFEQTLSRQEAEYRAATADLAEQTARQSQIEAELHARQQNLEEAEALLADGQTELERGRKQLAAERQAGHEQCAEQRLRLAEERRRADLDLNRRLEALKHHGEQLERRETAVEQLRNDVLRTQRETLELRLATDEIWAQMSGSLPPAILTQSLVRTRGKLADQYRLERVELAQRQEQLESLARRIEARHEKLRGERQETERWTADRRHEIEGTAARLAAKEQELARRQTELEEFQERQQSERRLYEADIRRLLAELRKMGDTVDGRR